MVTNYAITRQPDICTGAHTSPDWVFISSPSPPTQKGIIRAHVFPSPNAQKGKKVHLARRAPPYIYTRNPRKKEKMSSSVPRSVAFRRLPPLSMIHRSRVSGVGAGRGVVTRAPCGAALWRSCSLPLLVAAVVPWSRQRMVEAGPGRTVSRLGEGVSVDTDAPPRL